MRNLTLKIYFKGSPSPWTYYNVTDLVTEGGLLRILRSTNENEWFPLTEIFRIVQMPQENSSNPPPDKL